MHKERLKAAVDAVLPPVKKKKKDVSSARKDGRKPKRSGTTILAFRYEDGIICAADRQVTSGTTILTRDFQKIFPITPVSFLLGSGTVNTIQELSEDMHRRCKSFHEGHMVPMSVHGQLSYVLESCRAMGDNEAFDGILAGVNRDGRHHMFMMDDDGASIECSDFVTQGSGGDAAEVTLRSLWPQAWLKGLDLGTGIEIAVRCIVNAADIDTSSSHPKVATPSVAVIGGSAATFIPEEVVVETLKLFLRRQEEAIDSLPPIVRITSDRSHR